MYPLSGIQYGKKIQLHILEKSVIKAILAGNDIILMMLPLDNLHDFKLLINSIAQKAEQNNILFSRIVDSFNRIINVKKMFEIY